MDLTEKQLSCKNIYSGRVVKLDVCDVELPQGKSGIREVVRHSGGAAVLYVKDNKILLVKQYRFPYGKELYEIPAGKLNKGEDPMAAAARELTEETGCIAKSLKRLCEVYPSPGYTDEIIYVYLAEEITQSEQHLDEDEFINTCYMDINEVLCLIEQGKICDAKTLAAVYKYLYSNKIYLK